MNDYIFRKATLDDIGFLTEVVIAAEKSGSDKLSYATLFGISDEQAKKNIAAMFDEEIEGCELSVDSFVIAEYNGEAVAAFGAWIEGVDDETPSKILKSNLIGYTFGREAVEYLKTKAHLIKDLITEREPNALQFEYLFVSDAHRGKNLSNRIIQELEKLAKERYPQLQKAQVQLYANNTSAIKVYERNGFAVASSHRSDDPETLDYLPFNEKIIMEKTYK